MKCNDYIVWLSGHIDGTNSPREESALQAHLDACPNCRRLLEDMQSNDVALKNTTLVPPARIAENVMSVVRKDAKKKTTRIRSYILSSVAVAAVLCLVMIASVRMPDRVSEDPMGRSADTPAEAAMEDQEVAQDFPIADEAEAGKDDKSTRGVVKEDETTPLNCVFVELPSKSEIPPDITSANMEDFYTRITREALDWYYYGGSIVYSSAYMTETELSRFESQIQARFIQDNAESDMYVVIFCSESR